MKRLLRHLGRLPGAPPKWGAAARGETLLFGAALPELRLPRSTLSFALPAIGFFRDDTGSAQT